MNFVKFIICALTVMNVAHAKPVITGSNIKSYLNTVQLTLLDNRQWLHFKFYADAVVYPTGEIRLINPKLVLGRDFYGIQLDPRASLQSGHVRAVTNLADTVCASMERKAVRNRNGVLDTVVYPSEFKSLYTDVFGTHGVHAHSIVMTTEKKHVLSYIKCE